jgi:hypothetical protein
LRHECICVGACALIWFGAVDRVGSVGLHLTQTDDPSFKTPSPTEDTNVYRWVHDAIRRYLDEMETPEAIIQAMIKTNSADISWADAYDDRLTRPPGLAEWEDSNCAGFSLKDQDALSRLQTKRPSTNQEQRLRNDLETRQSSWFICQVELLSNHRDRLPAP